MSNPADQTDQTAIVDDDAVQTLADRLHADPDLGPGYLLREDCEHLARRVLSALGAETTHAYGVRAENGTQCHSSEDLARAATTENGFTLGSERSPIVAGLSRTVTTFPPLHSQWRDITGNQP